MNRCFASTPCLLIFIFYQSCTRRCTNAHADYICFTSVLPRNIPVLSSLCLTSILIPNLPPRSYIPGSIRRRRGRHRSCDAGGGNGRTGGASANRVKARNTGVPVRVPSWDACGRVRCPWCAVASAWGVPAAEIRTRQELQREMNAHRCRPFCCMY